MDVSNNFMAMDNHIAHKLYFMHVKKPIFSQNKSEFCRNITEYYIETNDRSIKIPASLCS